MCIREKRDNVQDSETPRFHILNFADMAEMTVKVTHVTFKTFSHKERNSGINLYDNHLIISWSVKSKDEKMSPFLILEWGYSLSLGSQDKLAKTSNHKFKL